MLCAMEFALFKRNKFKLFPLDLFAPRIFSMKIFQFFYVAIPADDHYARWRLQNWNISHATAYRARRQMPRPKKYKRAQLKKNKQNEQKTEEKNIYNTIFPEQTKSGSC